MREFIKITINLFVISVVAAALLGVVYIFTERERKSNFIHNLELSMRSYLPKEVLQEGNYKFNHIYRYLIEEGGSSKIGYLMPDKDGGHLLIIVSAEGELLARKGFDAGSEMDDEDARTEAMSVLMGPEVELTQTNTYIVASAGGQRLAYYAEGRTLGFKTWISMMVVLNPDNTIRGLEILEQEEDPGLGAEISQEYFRNQFVNKSLDQLAHLSVVKTPLPDDYKRALEESKWTRRGLSAEEASRIMQQHHDDQIYSITGSTISSASVTNGVKKIVDAFVKRMAIIDRLIQENGLPVDF